MSTRAAAWIARASATAAVATASRAANANHPHHVSRVQASYSAAAIGVLTISVGGAVVWEGHVHNQRDVEIDYQGGVNQAVTAALSAGAAGVVGMVSMTGS